MARLCLYELYNVNIFDLVIDLTLRMTYIQAITLYTPVDHCLLFFSEFRIYFSLKCGVVVVPVCLNGAVSGCATMLSPVLYDYNRKHCGGIWQYRLMCGTYKPVTKVYVSDDISHLLRNTARAMNMVSNFSSYALDKYSMV